MATDEVSAEGKTWPMPRFRFEVDLAGNHNRFFFHECPMETPVFVPIPHVGGPIPGPVVPTVSVEGTPVSLVGKMLKSTDSSDE